MFKVIDRIRHNIHEFVSEEEMVRTASELRFEYSEMDIPWEMWREENTIIIRWYNNTK